MYCNARPSNLSLSNIFPLSRDHCSTISHKIVLQKNPGTSIYIVVKNAEMKKLILILFLFFLFSTSLLAEEDVCDWIITDGDYQEYLDDLPSSDFHSAFHVVVGSDGRCSYGWDWSKTNKPIEHAIQLSFNDCEEWRI